MAKKKSPAATKELAAVDPRQAAFLSNYLDPKSKTFGNALQSALGAGYAQEYSESILTQRPAWLSEYLGKEKDRRLRLAEKHFNDVLEMPIIDQAMGAFGPVYEKKRISVKVKLKNGKTKMQSMIQKVPVMTYHTNRIKMKNDIAKVAAEVGDPASYRADNRPRFSFVFNAAGARDRFSKPD